MSTAQYPTEAKDTTLPGLRDSISVVKLREGSFAVRDTRTASYFQAGPKEAFLLQQLQKGTSWNSIKADFRKHFGQRASSSDLREFLQFLVQKKFLSSTGGLAALGVDLSTTKILPGGEDDDDDEVAIGKGNFLFFRIPLTNPNRFFHWFSKNFSFLWSTAFFLCSIGFILLALGIIVFNRQELTASFYSAIRWETTVLAVLAIVLATAIHELGHGATCAKYGGLVPESGLLFLFLMPCLYVNVSDAWLIPERRKRLAITFAGGYCDLLLWALSVMVWRLTLIGTLANQLAFVILTTCGTRALLNFNPLLRLDGYYLMADALEYPNLYSQARKYWVGFLNWRLWGAAKPTVPPRSRLAFFYGMSTWFFGIAFLNLVCWKLIQVAGNEFGLLGILFTSMLFLYGMRRVFRGFIGSEFVAMLRTKYMRTVIWLGVVGLLLAMAFLTVVNHYATGDFEVRSGRHVEIASPMHSFVAHVPVQDGQEVAAGDVLMELHAPELATQISAKSLELDQSSATLSKLQTGARAEEIKALEERAVRLKEWCEMGETDIETATSALRFLLKSLGERSEQVRLQIQLAEEVLKKSEELKSKGAVTGAQIIQERSALAVLRSQLLEFESQHEGRKTEGVRLQETELARRNQQLAEAESQLKLLRLGTRKEEIEAEQAKCNRLQEELAFLKQQQSKLIVRAPTAGIISAPRIREKLGHFAPQGSVLCEIEDAGIPQVEIYVSEDDAALIQKGQPVQLKARSLPFETFTGVVERVAPAAAKPRDAVASQQSFVRQSVVVHCAIEGAAQKLKTGMTGFGRISRGKNNVGSILLAKVYRYIRTEFWW